MFREINRAWSENNTNHINALCWQNSEFFYVKRISARNFHCVWSGWYTSSCTLYNILLALEFTEYFEIFYGLYWNIIHCVSGTGSVPVFKLPPKAQQPIVGQDLLVIQTSQSHSDTPRSVGLLWTSDQSHAETSTWQATTLTTDGHRTHDPRKRTAADQRCRTRGHWDRPSSETTVIAQSLFML
jgi:hypothetical protein